MCVTGDLVGALTVRPKIYCCVRIKGSDRLQLLNARSGRPDLTWKSQPLGHTYADLVVIGHAVCGESVTGKPSDYTNLLDTLLSAGVPVDNTDFAGKTALHHAAFRPRTGDLIKVLMKHKANVDLQDRFGASPLLIAIQEDSLDAIPVLLDAGADLDVTDSEGSSPRSAYIIRPAGTSNIVKNWLVHHKGRKAAIQGDRCSKCGTSGGSMKRCSRCRSQLYCSAECQSEFAPGPCYIYRRFILSLKGSDWKTHKQNCQPFDKEENLLIVKPGYTLPKFSGITLPESSVMSTISTVPASLGVARKTNPSGKFEANVRDGRNMVIKIQLPMGWNGGMLVYNKKRTFECLLHHETNPDAYRRIKKKISEKGIQGLKAYFAAELRSKDELAINVAECLPESRF